MGAEVYGLWEVSDYERRRRKKKKRKFFLSYSGSYCVFFEDLQDAAILRCHSSPMKNGKNGSDKEWSSATNGMRVGS